MRTISRKLFKEQGIPTFVFQDLNERGACTSREMVVIVAGEISILILIMQFPSSLKVATR